MFSLLRDNDKLLHVSNFHVRSAATYGLMFVLNYPPLDVHGKISENFVGFNESNFSVILHYSCYLNVYCGFYCFPFLWS